MPLVAPCLLALSRLADIPRQRTVVVAVQIIVHGLTIHHRVLHNYRRRYPEAVHNGSPVAVGVWTVALKLVHRGYHCTAQHGFPCGCLILLLYYHGTAQPIPLNKTQRRIMPIKPLQRLSIRVDDTQSLSVFPLFGEVPRRLHVAFAAAFAGPELSIAGYDLVRARQFVRLR